MRVIFAKADTAHLLTPSGSDGWLTIGHEYIVLSIYGGKDSVKFRILDDQKVTPALHSAEHFVITDPTVPPDWAFNLNSEEEEWRLGPTAWSADGFWSAFFDGDPSAQALFDNVAAKLGAS